MRIVLTSEGEYKRGAESVWTLSIPYGGGEQVRAKEQKCAVELSLEKQYVTEKRLGKEYPFPHTVQFVTVMVAVFQMACLKCRQVLAPASMDGHHLVQNTHVNRLDGSPSTP